VSLAARLDVRGRSVVVLGGTPDALSIVMNLLHAEAKVTVVAAELVTTLLDLTERSLITWRSHQPGPADLTGAALAVVRTGDRDLDASLLRAAEAAHVPVVVSDLVVGDLVVGDLAPLNNVPADQARTAGVVVLVGGGPGDPGLLTIAGLEAIRTADVIICDRLAPLAALDQARPDAEVIDVGKIPRGTFTSQERINELLVEHARQGKRVVRLKGGDSFIFGRGAEEWQACAAAGIAVQVIPGVSSAVAAPALAGIPLTHRNLTQGFSVVSAHLLPGDPGSTLDWAALARSNTTLVILMGVSTLAAVARAVTAAGLAGDTPAATIADAGLPSQQVVHGTVADIADRVDAAGLKPPAVTVIGAVAGFTPDDPATG
jgi:uroporphyrin-III C-methyltransferase